jgi:hypothetical protein
MIKQIKFILKIIMICPVFSYRIYSMDQQIQTDAISQRKRDNFQNLLQHLTDNDFQKYSNEIKLSDQERKEKIQIIKNKIDKCKKLIEDFLLKQNILTKKIQELNIDKDELNKDTFSLQKILPDYKRKLFEIENNIQENTKQLKNNRKKEIEPLNILKQEIINHYFYILKINKSFYDENNQFDNLELLIKYQEEIKNTENLNYELREITKETICDEYIKKIEDILKYD